MPWEMIWVPPEELAELSMELPEGAETWGSVGMDNFLRARLGDEEWYECRKPFKDSVIGCGGWVKGRPSEDYEDNMEFLCGRKGTVYHCTRCGKEVGFDGAIS